MLENLETVVSLLKIFMGEFNVNNSRSNVKRRKLCYGSFSDGHSFSFVKRFAVIRK